VPRSSTCITSRATGSGHGCPASARTWSRVWGLGVFPDPADLAAAPLYGWLSLHGAAAVTADSGRPCRGRDRGRGAARAHDGGPVRRRHGAVQPGPAGRGAPRADRHRTPRLVFSPRIIFSWNRHEGRHPRGREAARGRRPRTRRPARGPRLPRQPRRAGSGPSASPTGSPSSTGSPRGDGRPPAPRRRRGVGPRDRFGTPVTIRIAGLRRPGRPPDAERPRMALAEFSPSSSSIADQAATTAAIRHVLDLPGGCRRRRSGGGAGAGRRARRPRDHMLGVEATYRTPSRPRPRRTERTDGPVTR
jgi:hypothetical protein